MGKETDYQRHEQPGWCGPATMKFIADAEGLYYTQGQLAKLMGTTHEDGTTHMGMFICALNMGLKPAMVHGQTIEFLGSILKSHHVVVNWMDGPNEKDDGHYSVLKEVKDGVVYLQDNQLPLKEFNKQWYDLVNDQRVEHWALVIEKTK